MMVVMSDLGTSLLYTPGNIRGTRCCYKLSRQKTIVWLEGLCQLRIPMTPSGIEPATIGLVAHILCIRATYTHIYLFIYAMFRHEIIH